MSFVVTVGNNITLGAETVKTVEFIAETPQDSNARTTDLGVTMKITGKILTVLDEGSENTVELATWAMVPVEQADCYRSVTVKSVAAGQVVRQYILPTAFVVDYTETYGDTEGVGTFELTIKQKKDKVQKTAITGGYAD
ncbi:MAG: membrane-associated protease 1 [Lachnospiraceae bacterium]|nr:membrane-associated protease 1 [Lachnospiraceae bacterium]